MTDFSFRRKSISRHRAAWPRTEWLLAPSSDTAIYFTDNRAARACSYLLTPSVEIKNDRSFYIHISYRLYVAVFIQYLFTLSHKSVGYQLLLCDDK
jgi:hypothetical protein